VLPLAAGDRRDDADLFGPLQARVEAVALAHVFAVDVDVHERAKGAALVEEQARYRKLAQRLHDRGGTGLEPRLAARLCRQERRQQDYGQSATSTERIGGRLPAASVQRPSRERAKTEPLCMPR
jgi:hypothetical protein